MISDQTEVSLPDSWRIQPLSAFTAMRPGTINPANYANETFEYYSIPAYQDNQCPTTAKGGEIGSSKLLLDSGIVLFGKLNPRVEKVWRVGNHTSHRKIGSTEWLPLLPRDDVDEQFLYFLMWSEHVMPKAKTLVSGSTPSRQRVDPRSFYRIEAPLPPLPEQQKIAGVLGLVQKAMEEQERLMALTAELKKTLLHQLFTQGLRGEPQKPSEIGPVPESWEIVKFADLFEIKHGYAFDGKFFKETGEYILLTPGHFFEEGGFRDQKEKTKYFTGKIPDGYILRTGDLLVAMTEQKSGLLGSSIIIPESEKFLHNQRLGLVVDLKTDRLGKLFLFYLFNTADIRKEIAKNSSGSKVRHTSPGKIRDLRVSLPTVEEQRQIVETLQAVDARIDVLKRKHDTLTDLFHTLLHQLMTARIRVNGIDMPELENTQ